ncbi:bifunctional adenosylcobinamide kinase/adenosylcobinamide-phosphate guanylyltransferase [Cohnella thailandensis]|uniref:Adenosylcobinamide kinase n=1 Tax=Cohnella thailandensis TaxID=557557 RepID=A0A841T264_9BACL|nr:bifunctional adenosylcobinamide kinase/adenosylcobinamide-phosphate guanylyltransferase [Cohnella thailandensis]MBB6635171.1 bifunctional adenosylcobinamide kinase/adenosylcobinamide-phosphate guanylyltransferase [Cohnella thailandensis]MBP1974363.1 adenosylcobinamide kinase/adenosylcobinamide-phosphate guanylyltransferase [Cohnella thailandensis]
MVVLVTGGARSGKSSFAEKYAAKRADSGIYIATAQALDEGMERRIDKHRNLRDGSGFRWETVEEPMELPGRLNRLADEATGEPAPLVLVDCLTLWLTNVLLEEENEEGERAEERALKRIEGLADALSRYPGQAILVTNEVGDGIVPEYPLGRLFRDLAGILNQRIAAISEEVFLVTAGIPLELKSLAYRWTD